MRKIILMSIQVIQAISIGWLILAVFLGVLYEFVGYQKFEQMLSTIGVTNGFNLIWIISLIIFVLLVIIHFIKPRLL